MPPAAPPDSEPSTSAPRATSSEPESPAERQRATLLGAGGLLTGMGALALAVARLVDDAARPGPVAAGAAYLSAAVPLITGVILLVRAARARSSTATPGALIASDPPSTSGHGESN